MSKVVMSVIFGNVAPDLFEVPHTWSRNRTAEVRLRRAPDAFQDIIQTRQDVPQL
jgi:hypothetical protein